MQPECFDLAAYKHPFKNSDAFFGPIAEGITIAEIVRGAGIDPRFLMDVHVTVSRGLNSSVVPMSDWHKVRPRAGSHVLVTPFVQGPAAGAILAALLPSAASYVAGTLFALEVGTFVYAAVYAAVTIVGSLLINALIPPPSAPQSATQDDPNFSITGSSNAENRYGVYPTVLGRHLMYPPMTARGYTEGEADNIHFRGRFTFGYGPVALETLKIGSTPITEFEGVSIELRNVDRTRTLQHMPELDGLVTAWRSGSETMVLYPDDIAEDGYSVKLEQNQSIVRVTRDRAESVSIDVTYQGLVAFDSNNNKQNRSVSIRYRYRAVGSSTWISAGTATHTGKSTASLRFTKSITFSSAGEYEVEVTRLSGDSDDASIRDESYLTAIRSVQAGNLPSPEDVAEIVIRVKASEQLNGQIDTLNAVVEQMAPVWTGSGWTAPQPVRHPAWIYARALMGPMLRNSIEPDRIQLGDLLSWANNEPNWTCDAVIDQPATVAEVLDTICAAGRARRTLRDLKYSVIRDGGAGPVVQQFSPRNSWGFEGSIKFPKQIHGFRVRCLSERLEWQQDEFEVYADGYSASTATELETLELRGVVLDKGSATQSNAWRLARYHLAQAILRPEEFSWQCDLEHLRVNMGDKVRLVHDVPKIGVGAGRIKEINTRSGGFLDTIVLDELLMLEGASYRLVARRQNGEMQEFNASPPTSFDGEWTVTSNVSASLFEFGDLVAIEEVTQESMDVLITSIRHGENLSATLTGVPAAPEVLSADSGVIPPYEPIITNVIPKTSLRPAVPEITSADVEARLSPLGIFGVVEWQTDVYGVERWDVYRRLPSGVRSLYARVTEPVVDVLLPEIGDYEIEVFAVGQGGTSLGATTTVERDAAIGSADDVEGFQIDVTGNQAQLTWDAGGSLVSHYELRYLAAGEPPAHGWEEAQLVASRLQGTSTGLRWLTGRYFLKAVSVFDQHSVTAAAVDTTPFAPDAPVIDDVTVQARFDPSRVTATATWTGGAGLTYLVDLVAPNGQRSRVGETDLTTFEFNTPAVGSYVVEVTARGAGGFLSVPVRQSFQRSLDVEIPAGVTGFRVDVTGNQALLTWDAGGALVSHYHIKHVPEGIAQEWPQALDVLTDVVGRTATVPALRGSYLIRAVSVFDRNSPTSTVVSTNTQFLDDYNVVETVNAAPAFAGDKTSGLMLVDGGLETVSQTRMSDWGALSSVGPLLQQGGVTTDAIYTFAAPFDLGAVYTSRVTAQVEALGFSVSNNLLSWPRLSEVQSLLGAAPERWSCELQIRTTEDDPASSPTWTDWAAFRLGDYVARGYEFRCVFQSDDPNVVVRLTSAAVQIDMPPRDAAGDDVICPPAGVYVPFVPPFRTKPAINVTGQELPSGARSVRSNVSADGFHQQFVDANDNGVSCSFDWQAKGYGRVQS